MSNAVIYNPLSLAEVFRLGNIQVHEYDGDVVLTVLDGLKSRLLHLYENQTDDRLMYGLNVGQFVDFGEEPVFVGSPSALELSFAKDELAWDFLSIVLRNGEGKSLTIRRNDASFPEPTFSMAQ